MIKRFLKRMLCRHENMTFLRNLTEEETQKTGGREHSKWQCSHCHRIVLAERKNDAQ